MGLERFDEGIANFNAALIIDPDDAEVLHNLEVAEYRKIVNTAGSEILLNPDDTEALLNRGQALVGLEQYEEALTDFDTVLELDPEADQAFMGRAGALEGLKRYKEALAGYDAVLELNTEPAAAYAGRARVQAQLERPMEAIADSSAALELDPDLSEIADLRSELQSQMALLPDATVNFASNLRGGPGTNYPVVGEQLEGNRVKPFVRTADEQWIKLVQGVWIHASLLDDVSLDLAITQQIPTVPGEATTVPEAPLTVTDYLNQGLDQARARKYPQALATYAEALVVDSENAAVLGRVGVAKAFLGEYAEAIEDLNSAISLSPDYASAYAFRGMAKALQGNYTEAIADLDEAIDMVSDSSYVPGSQELSLAHPLESQAMHGYRLFAYVNALRDQVRSLSSE